MSAGKSPSPVRVGSYNLRVDFLDKGENAWSVRKDRLEKSISNCKFDVFAVEEVTTLMQKDLPEMVGPAYKCLFFSPYGQDGVGDKAQGIIYRKSRFKVVDYHYFWPSDNPDVMTENDRTWLPSRNKYHYYNRGGMCVMFKDCKSGKRFFVMLSHMALDSEFNEKYAHVFEEMERKYNPIGYPSFFVGDFNTRPDTPTSRILRQYWTDSAMGTDEGATYNGYKIAKNWDESDYRIDYVYWRNLSQAPAYHCERSLIDGKFASDHFPIWVDAIIK